MFFKHSSIEEVCIPNSIRNLWQADKRNQNPYLMYVVCRICGLWLYYVLLLFIHMQGGEGTREEMCFAFVNYYPRMESDLAVCVSVPDAAGYVPFIRDEVP